MPLEITITDAGRAAIINAENTGTGPVTISEIALGNGQYTPTPSQSALQTETKRLSTIAGAAVDDDVIHVTMSDTSTDSYSVGEIGLFTDAGVLLAVYAQPAGTGWIIEKASQAQLMLAIDITLASVSAASITFGDTDFSNAPATEAVPGVIRIASEQETLDGAGNDTAVSPQGLDAVVTILNQLINNNGDAIEALQTVTPVVSKEFLSTEQIITPAGQLTLSHGLAVQPKIIQATLVCKTADSGYNPDDTVYIHSSHGDDGASGTGMSLMATDSEIKIRYGSNSGVFILNNPTSGSRDPISPADWRLVIRAFA